MHSRDFADFVASQQEDSPENPSAAKARSDKRRKEWLQNLDHLYKLILKYLDEYLREKTISYSYKQITLHEARLGRYKVNSMNITIGKQVVTLEP